MLPSASPVGLSEDDTPARSRDGAADNGMAAVYKQAKTTSYPCRVCGLILPSSQSLGGHLSRVHGGTRGSEGSRQKTRVASLKPQSGKSRFHSSDTQPDGGEEHFRRRCPTAKQLNTSEAGEPDESQDDSFETNVFASAAEASKAARTRPTNNQLL